LHFPGLYPDTTTVDVTVVRLTGWAAFSAGFTGIPDVWSRSSGTIGIHDTTTYDYEYEVEEGMVIPGTVTAQGCSLQTQLYRIPGFGWYPAPPESARVAFTAIGASSLVGVGHEVENSASGIRTVAPNPCVGQECRIGVNIRKGDWALRIYDVRGRLIKRWLLQGRSPGLMQVVWDRTDERGHLMPGGVYFLNLDGLGHETRASVKRIVLLR
jgi:hypothetical protein